MTQTQPLPNSPEYKLSISIRGSGVQSCLALACSVTLGRTPTIPEFSFLICKQEQYLMGLVCE